MKTIMEIPLAGHRYPHLICDSADCSCGPIDDGIGFKFPGEGGWVMAFEDLEKLYFRLKDIRSAE